MNHQYPFTKMVNVSKNQRIKDVTPGGSNLLVQLKRLHKRLSQSMGRLEESFVDIDNVDDDVRKTKVQAISSELFDLSEELHDLNLGVDEVLGDDMLNLNEKEVLDQFESLEVIPAIIDDFETKLKNFHKTYYDKTIENDLKVLSFDTIARNWKSLSKNINRIISNLDGLMQQIT